MTDIWSLVIFTLMGQCSVGLSLFIALDHADCQAEGRAWTAKAVLQTWVSLIVLGVGMLISLTHLSSPLLSVYTLSDVANSWLSREILFAGLFGAVLLAGVVLKVAFLRYLAPIVGLCFIFVMSKVYMIPNQPEWNTWITPATFYTTGILLGAALKLFLDSLHARRNPAYAGTFLRGCLPIFLSLAAAVRVVLLVLQSSLPEHAHLLYEAVHAGLLMLAAGPGLLLLVRGAGAECTGSQCAPPCKCVAPSIGLLGILLVVAELCGRAVFYKSYVWFGM